MLGSELIGILERDVEFLGKRFLRLRHNLGKIEIDSCLENPQFVSTPEYEKIIENTSSEGFKSVLEGLKARKYVPYSVSFVGAKMQLAYKETIFLSRLLSAYKFDTEIYLQARKNEMYFIVTILNPDN